MSQWFVYPDRNEHSQIEKIGIKIVEEFEREKDESTKKGFINVDMISELRILMVVMKDIRNKNDIKNEI